MAAGDAGARSQLGDAKRKIVWGKIINSLQPDMRTKMRPIALGEVEELLRSIRSEFFKDSASTRHRLKEKIRSSKLEDFPDVSQYIMSMLQTAHRLKTIGSALTDEDVAFDIYRGLPVDYDMVVRALKMPRDSTAHHEADPGPAGGLRHQPARTRHDEQGDAQGHRLQHRRPRRGMEICKRNTMGLCTWGDKCKYRHVDPPGGVNVRRYNHAKKTCYKCGKVGHIGRDCRGGKPRSTPDQTTPGDQTYLSTEQQQQRRQQPQQQPGQQEQPQHQPDRRQQPQHEQSQQPAAPQFHVDYTFASQPYEPSNYDFAPGTQPPADAVVIDEVQVTTARHPAHPQHSAPPARDHSRHSTTPLTQTTVPMLAFMVIVWLVDGGSTCHVVQDESLCQNLRKTNIHIKVGGGVVKCGMIGDVVVTAGTPDSPTTIVLTDVRIVPDFGCNIISERAFLRQQCSVHKLSPHLNITKNDRTIVQATESPANGLFYATTELPTKPIAKHKPPDIVKYTAPTLITEHTPTGILPESPPIATARMPTIITSTGKILNTDEYICNNEQTQQPNHYYDDTTANTAPTTTTNSHAAPATSVSRAIPTTTTTSDPAPANRDSSHPARSYSPDVLTSPTLAPSTGPPQLRRRRQAPRHPAPEEADFLHLVCGSE